MITVARLPVQTVTSEPYMSVHCLNLYHGFCGGKSHLFPTKGTGCGPGGLQHKQIRSARFSNHWPLLRPWETHIVAFRRISFRVA